jgi:hypothetical protein
MSSSIELALNGLPFAKRPARMRPVPAPSPHTTFGQVIFHSPLNQQMQPDRQHQEGNLRQVEMKADPDYVDGRLDQVDRNRLNMFSEYGAAIDDPTDTINPPITRGTRHAYTPYSYSTYWISHAPADSSLAPLKSEAYLTSFLATPFTEMDHRRRASHIQSKYDALRANDDAFRARVKGLNIAAHVGHERTVQNLRDQEAAYVKALEVRNRIENPYRFEKL